MGLSESSLNTITKPLSSLSHCKVSCDSPCCVRICGDNKSIAGIIEDESLET